MRCPSCAADNPAGHRFCGQCGTPLALICRRCSAEIPTGNAFCGQCGTPVAQTAGAPPPAPVTPATGSPATESLEDILGGGQAERRHVSVLFVDLVGFTSMSEDQDPEAVRELLSDYFEQARTIVDRYGGTIEKFIGDAVMAVWGTPVAREDDAERAVRAGFDIIDAVTALGEGPGRESLAARAGVVTGEAAVRLDAVNQGMVAGDVVNTAARVQTAANPGTLMVDEATREASSRAINYAASGEFELKGKTDPVRLYTAMQVVAGVGGAQRFDGLEAPFLGRERDLRMVKELFHDSAEQSRVRLVVVSGAAGVGKSRLGWEFFKYIDGIRQVTRWHVGRCLSYGDGVAYWALAEMVRMRCRISEGDTEQIALAKLDEGLDTYIEDADERAWIRPRLAVLLGLADVLGPDEDMPRDSLFAGWRLFLERLAQKDPVVLLFEDMQYADSGLLEFIDYLLEWSTDLPIFMLAFTRPEMQEDRPSWGSHHRNVTTLYLDPLSDDAISQMVDALVEGLPETTRRALATRAEGIPLFAIETVRMLIDRDLVVPRGGVYVLARDIGDLSELDVPPTLQALVAARLDNLPEEERRLIKDTAVLGLSFTLGAAIEMEAAVDGIPAVVIEELLTNLTRKEILSIQGDARSPEAGQYRFVQKVMRTVAYDTLSRRDRKVRHLAAAAHLRSANDAEDIAGVIATHYLSAAEAVPEDPDAATLLATAVQHLERAGDRARSLAAVDEALRYYERALKLVDTDADRARLAEHAGAMAIKAGESNRALEHLAIAHSIHDASGDLRALARIASFEGDVMVSQDRVVDALDLMTDIYERQTDDAAYDANLAQLSNSIATAHFQWGTSGDVDPWLDRAITIAEGAGAWDVLGRALNVKGLRLYGIGRPVEGRGLMRAALELALQHGLHYRAAIQSGNLALLGMYRDLHEALRLAQEAEVQARRAGDRTNEAFASQVLALVRLHRGDWSDIDEPELRRQILRIDALTRVSLAVPLAALATWRAEPDGLEGLALELDHSFADLQAHAAILTIRALKEQSTGNMEKALEDAREALRLGVSLGFETDELLITMPMVVDCAVAVGRLDIARSMLADVSARPPGLIPPMMRALQQWSEGRVTAAEGASERPDSLFESAAKTFSDLGAKFWLARTHLDHADWLNERGLGHRARPLAEQALTVMTELRAAPFVSQAQRILGTLRSDATVMSD